MLLPRITILLVLCSAYQTRAEVDLITEPRPGEEYVLVSGGKDQTLNFETSHKIPEKLSTQHLSRPAESHDKSKKLSKSHSSPVIDALSNNKNTAKIHASEGIVSIEQDKKPKKGNKEKALEAIEIDVPASKLEEIKIKETVKETEVNPDMSVALETLSESGKLTGGSGTTTQKPVLTTTPPATTRSYDVIPINFDTIDDINSGLLSSNVKLEQAGSEQKQHSRIQIKKGPNGQDYEYEYIYYYEDEEDDALKGKDAKSVTASEVVHNSHDGPQKAENEVAKNSGKNKNKYSNIERTTVTTAASTTVAAPDAQNEILPAGQRSRQRGRNLVPAPVQEDIIEERLPASTRFPPRSRNLNATPTTPEPLSEPAKQRGRPQFDSVADESIGQTRSRPRAHVRRPSSELVDLASFNTHSGDIPPSQYKELPSRFTAEGKVGTESAEPTKPVSRLTPANELVKQDILQAAETPREAHSLSGASKAQNIFDDAKQPVEYKPTTSTSYDRETTEYTTMMAMEKVALDLYAYLAGENLNNEINPTGDDLVNFDGSTTEFSEEVSTTELTSTTEEATTSTTTTTTTTTTTPAPTTTTTTTSPAQTTRASRFGNRASGRGRVPSVATSSATEAPVETSTKLRGRFNRPSFGAGRHRASTAAPASEAQVPVDEVATKQVESSLAQAAPKAPIGSGRTRFGGRTRPTTAATTAASTAAPTHDSAPAADHTATRSRLRPSFHLRERRPVASTAGTSAAPASDDTAAAVTSAAPASSAGEGAVEEISEAPAVTPARGIGRGRLPGLRPLRPGPRLNIGRGASSTTASVAPVTEHSSPETAASSAEHHEETNSESTETTPSNPLQRLRGRPRLQLAPTPKPKVAAPASPVRRLNPLISRRRPVAEVSEAPTEASEAPATEAAEASTGLSDSPKETEAESPETPAETTPAPRGLSNLLARRRLVQRRPGTVA